MYQLEIEQKSQDDPDGWVTWKELAGFAEELYHFKRKVGELTARVQQLEEEKCQK